MGSRPFRAAARKDGWTATEEKRLAILAADNTCVQDIARELDRSQGAVSHRALRLGLKVKSRPSDARRSAALCAKA